MMLQAAYPLITTMNLRATRDFYVENFGLEVIFEASWVVMLGRPGAGQICIGFMASNHPTNPPGPDAFDGRGMIVTMQVEDAKQACTMLRRKGAPITYDLHDEPWGQRRFTTLDPSGIIVDVVQQTMPAEGYWEKFLPERETAAA
jgi:uncharacterized glyoxalase superfamily protein PhnB